MMKDIKTIIDFWPEIVNAQVVHDFYGKWPSLHDAEIIEINLNRELGYDFTGPKVKLELYWCADWHASASAKRRGSKITLLCEKTELQYLKDSNHQNALADFNMTKSYSKRLRQQRYKIQIGEFGAKLKLTCSTVKVLAIVPHEPKDYFKKQ